MPWERNSLKQRAARIAQQRPRNAWLPQRTARGPSSANRCTQAFAFLAKPGAQLTREGQPECAWEAGVTAEAEAKTPDCSPVAIELVTEPRAVPRTGATRARPAPASQGAQRGAASAWSCARQALVSMLTQAGAPAGRGTQQPVGLWPGPLRWRLQRQPTPRLLCAPAQALGILASLGLTRCAGSLHAQRGRQGPGGTIAGGHVLEDRRRGKNGRPARRRCGVFDG